MTLSVQTPIVDSIHPMPHKQLRQDPIVLHWRRKTERSIEALKAFLTIIDKAAQPTLAPTTEAEFMAMLGQLNDVALHDWVDEPSLDALFEILTGLPIQHDVRIPYDLVVTQ